MNMYESLARPWRGREGEVCIEVPGGQSWSFADLDRLSARFAAVLARHGALRGERVAAQVDKSVHAVALYLACLRTGAIFLPLNTSYQRSELQYFFADAEPRLVVVRPGQEDMAQAIADAPVVTLAADGTGSCLENADQPLDQVAAVEDGEIAAILYTSGTTGKPKGAMLTHGNLRSNTEVLHRVWQFRPSDVLLHALPIFHVHGLFVALHLALHNGSRMLFLPAFDPAAVVGLLPRASVFMGVPTFYTRLLAEPSLDRAACKNVRLFVAGSAPLLPQTFAEFEDRTGHRVVERYGMTETLMNTSNPPGGERPGSVGPALPGTEIRVADGEGRVLGVGETGVVEVRGPNVFQGYWRLPEKTREEFRADGFFITGDLGQLAADGYLSIVGRAKDLIISGGYNVYPREIEERIDDLPGVIESAVVGVPHPDFGEAVVAMVRLEPGATLTETDLIGRLKQEIAGFKVPKRVVFVPDLPRNTMGKVQKNLLRDQLRDAFVKA